MSFFAVLIALILEQVKPLPRHNIVHEALVGWIRFAGRNFDAGREHHAWVVWIITVALPAVLAGAIFVGLSALSLTLALIWSVLVLYVTLGFRQFSHHFTEIREALERGNEDDARQMLAQWRHLDTVDLSRGELLRHVIEHSLLAAHRHVFGVFFWFIVLAALGGGPAGAVLYRLAEFASRYWTFKSRAADAMSHERVMRLSQAMFSLIDHVPARLTAFGFAVVGNFEEAVNCWRRDAGLWRQPNEGVLLAAAAGAIGVRLGGTPAAGRGADGSPVDTPAAAGSTPGLMPQAAHLDTLVGLVWRSVVLWLLLTALLSLAHLIG